MEKRPIIPEGNREYVLAKRELDVRWYLSEDDMTINWEWPVTESYLEHRERVPFMRSITYEMPSDPEQLRLTSQQGRVLSLNLSSGGILFLTEVRFEPGQILKVHVPSSISNVIQTPTLAQVCWRRPVPLDPYGDLYFVGVKFVF